MLTGTETKQRYVIDWQIAGSFEVMAYSKAAAIEAFEKAWESPRGIMPMRDGEATNSEPYLAD